jgi:BirA family biotin operon repressor/biotin-[acetyl-CoA-carboxylase] ligase
LKIINLSKTDSTNNYAKQLIKLKKDVVITAKTQTKGKGSKGRSFDSEKGGLYFTRLKFYNNFKADKGFKIMVSVSVAVCSLLNQLGFESKIKWPNDIYIGDKKICGMLIENSFLNDEITSSIAGIGINVNNIIPEELKLTAVSLREIAGKKLNIKKIRDLLIVNLDKEYTIEEYKKLSLVINKKINIISGNENYQALAKDISESGQLIIEKDNKIIKLNSGEVSVRL